MIGDGVIAESYVSFDITWDNPGNGAQSTWNQNDQYVEFHSVDVYPDLEYTKASATATYYKYTSINKIMDLVDQINQVIDAKLGKSSILEAGEVSQVSSKVSPESPVAKDKVDIKKPNLSEPAEPEIKSELQSYTVNVIGERLRLVDVQRTGAGYSEVSISHKVSDNMVRETGDQRNDNSEKIKAVVKAGGLLGEKIEIPYADFNSENGRNLLVEILPSIDLRLTPSESAVMPRPETSRDDDAWLLDVRKFMKGSSVEKEIIAANDAEKVKAGANK